MRRTFYPLLALALAGCTVTPTARTVVAQPGLASPTTPSTGLASSAGTAAATQTAQPAAGTTGIGPGSTASAGLATSIGTSANPFGLPTSISVPLPSGVIASGGANVINAGGANYRLFNTTPSVINQALQWDMEGYVYSILATNFILRALAGQTVTPDTPMSLGNFAGINNITAVLHVSADHALLSVGQNGSATGANQLLAIRYTSPSQGTAVFRLTEPNFRVNLTTTYDLTKGVASADAAYTEKPDTLTLHIDISHPTTGPNFTIRSASFLRSTAAGLVPDGICALSANYAQDGQAAVIAGVENAKTNNQLELLSSDTGLPTTDPQAHTDWYLDGSGQDETRTQASAAAQALVPAASTLPTSYPADPNVGDPFADARFNFPQ